MPRSAEAESLALSFKDSRLRLSFDACATRQAPNDKRSREFHPYLSQHLVELPNMAIRDRPLQSYGTSGVGITGHQGRFPIAFVKIFGKDLKRLLLTEPDLLFLLAV